MPDKETLRHGFQLGKWEVLPDRGLITADGEERRLEPKVMSVLVELAAQQGEVVRKDDLVTTVWEERFVGDDVITTAIRGVRIGLGDNARNPEYVENIPKIGYRLIKPVTGLAEAESPPDSEMHRPTAPFYVPWIGGFAAVMVILAIVILIGPPHKDVSSVAVFPFECATEDQILCYGFAEELISKLLQATDIDQRFRVVRSRDPYPQDPGERTIADRSNVDAILVGSLLKSGDQIHINVQVQDRLDDSIYITRSYDGVLSDAVELRIRLADDVVKDLLRDHAAELKADSEPASFEALEAYSMGQYQLSIRSIESINSAIDAFEETIRLDPAFGPAYVNLAYAFALLPEYDTAAPKNRFYGKAQQAADEGVRVDPTVHGPAQTVHGYIDHQRGLWANSDRAHVDAISASTVYPISHQLYSQLLASVGRLDEALAEAKKAREIDPQQAVLISRLAIAYFWLDDLENAAFYFDMSEAHIEYKAPIHDLAYSLFLIRTGDYDAAARHAMAGLDKFGVDSSWVPAVFRGIYEPQKYSEAHAIITKLSNAELLTPTAEITLWVLLNDGERAMQVARLLESEGEVFPSEAIFIPQFSVLRQHEDFPALLDSIGLTEYWESIGCAWRDQSVVCDHTP